MCCGSVCALHHWLQRAGSSAGWSFLLSPVGVLGAGVTAAEHYGPSADGTEKVMNAFSAVLPPQTASQALNQADNLFHSSLSSHAPLQGYFFYFFHPFNRNEGRGDLWTQWPVLLCCQSWRSRSC